MMAEEAIDEAQRLRGINMSGRWYENTELIKHVFLFLAPLAFAGLFLGLPDLADRLYRGFGFRITASRARIVGYLALAIGAFGGVRLAVYLVQSN